MKNASIEANKARIARKRIDADSPYTSPSTPKIIGEIAPGRVPIENRIPKANPFFWTGLTSVMYAVNDGTPKKNEKPMIVKTMMRSPNSIDNVSITKQGATIPVDMIMNGTRFPNRSDKGAPTS
jgi:hypothetical protein